MNTITDEQALKKANSIEWFDNQANCVDFIKPKKTVKKDFKKPKNLEEMTVEQLQDEYVLAKSQLDCFRDIPKELHGLLNEKANKVFGYMSAVKRVLRKKQNSEQNMILDELEFLRQGKNSKGDNEVNRLKGEIAALKNNIEQMKQSKQLEKQKRNIEISRNREMMIHKKFKEIIRNHVGESKYLSLIMEADMMADNELNSQQ